MWNIPVSTFWHTCSLCKLPHTCCQPWGRLGVAWERTFSSSSPSPMRDGWGRERESERARAREGCPLWCGEGHCLRQPAVRPLVRPHLPGRGPVSRPLGAAQFPPWPPEALAPVSSGDSRGLSFSAFTHSLHSGGTQGLEPHRRCPGPGLYSVV